MLTLYSTSEPGIIAFRFPFNRKANPDYSAFPGCHYGGDAYDKGIWVAPMEAREHLESVAEKYGYGIIDETDEFESAEFIRQPDSRCYDFQVEILNRIASDPCLDWGLLANLDMGLGKTLLSIQAFRCFYQGGYALIATPVRSVWEDEIEKWDDRPDKEVRIIKTGKAAREIAEWLQTAPDTTQKAHYFVTSYQLLKDFVHNDLSDRFHIMIGDEIHMLANPNSGFSKNWAHIRRNNPGALALGLTGTPVPDRIPQLAPQVSAIWPNRFGGKWKFTIRHFHCTETGYNNSLVIGDMREDRLPELQERLSAVSVRITKDEVSHLLPTLSTQRVEIPFKKENRKKALALAEEDFEEYLQKHADRRIKEATEWIENTGQSHVCAVTYHVDTAERLAEMLQEKGYRSTAITGKMTQEARKAAIKSSLEEDQHFLVCSMKSVGVGVDVLAGYSTALFVELSYRPVDVMQTMGRFYRLSSLKPVMIGFLLLRGTLDDVLMSILHPKIDQFARTMKSGVSDKKLQDVLEDNETDESFFARMREVVSESEDW